jgi:hypothetical protein
MFDEFRPRNHVRHLMVFPFVQKNRIIGIFFSLPPFQAVDGIKIHAACHRWNSISTFHSFWKGLSILLVWISWHRIFLFFFLISSSCNSSHLKLPCESSTLQQQSSINFNHPKLYGFLSIIILDLGGVSCISHHPVMWNKLLDYTRTNW